MRVSPASRGTLFSLSICWPLINNSYLWENNNYQFYMAIHKTLTKAKVGKADEFYTQLVDIENELRHYKKHFKGMTVLCNCDDPRVSNFFRYFTLNFEALGLKKVIATCYKNCEPDLFSQNDCEHSVYITYEGDKNGNRVPDPSEMEVLSLKGDGDFRSQECIELLKQADIVCTNPPFSLFREYVAQLIEYDKKFIIIGHQNALTYKEIFPLIKDNKMWLGYGFKGGAAHFISRYEDVATAGNHKEGMIRVSGVVWFTNLDIEKRHEDLILYKKYTPEEYPYFDNYDVAINVNKTSDIPCDFDGLMGVPITFMDKYSPDQFEIITLGIGEGNFKPTKFYGKFRDAKTGLPTNDKRDYLLYIKDVNGPYLTEEGYCVNKLYARIIIKRKQQNTPTVPNLF